MRCSAAKSDENKASAIAAATSHPVAPGIARTADRAGAKQSISGFGVKRKREFAPGAATRAETAFSAILARRGETSEDEKLKPIGG